jgi:hypothetical protein
MKTTPLVLGAALAFAATAACPLAARADDVRPASPTAPASAMAAPASAAPAPASAAPAPGIRVVVRHEGLLRSETRALDALVTALTRRKLGPVTRVDATPAEAALFGGAPAAALPAEWGAGGVVVLLHVLSPTGQPDGRRSSGLGSVLVFRPPEVAPVYVERFEGAEGLSFGDSTLAGTLADLATVATAQDTPAKKGSDK